MQEVLGFGRVWKVVCVERAQIILEILALLCHRRIRRLTRVTVGICRAIAEDGAAGVKTRKAHEGAGAHVGEVMEGRTKSEVRET